MLSYVTLVNLTVFKFLLLFFYYLSRTTLKPISFLPVIILLFLISLMYYSGNVISHDSVVYYIPYYNNETWRTFEPGYLLINEIFQIFGFDSEQFLMSVSILTFFLFSYSLYKLNNDFTLFLISLFILFSTLSFNFLATGLLRQYIAFVLVFVSLVFLSKGKNSFYYLLVLVSSSVHFSSLIYLGAIRVCKISFVNKIKLLLLSFLLAMFSKPIISIIVYFLPLVSDNIYLKSLTRVLGYSDKNLVHDNYIFKYSIVFICMLSMGLYYLYKIKGDLSLKVFEVIFSFSVCGFLLSSLSYFSSEASIRMLYGVVVLNSCAFGVLLRNIDSSFKDVIIGFVLFCLFIYSFFTHQWITEFVNRYI
ncbi:EpsG family protein [Vibrio cyclitrophicus]|uniref:EpsG family protein n=1 Tax=Vibrio cyclitrophicus TaxID=47951 RepID=UPI0038B44E53